MENARQEPGIKTHIRTSNFTSKRGKSASFSPIFEIAPFRPSRRIRRLAKWGFEPPVSAYLAEEVMGRVHVHVSTTNTDQPDVRFFFFVFAHLARIAFLAISLRCAGVSFSSLALAPSCPSSTAWGFFSFLLAIS